MQLFFVFPLSEMSSEAELVRICESSLPSFLLDFVASKWNKNIASDIWNCLSLMWTTFSSSSAFLSRHSNKFLTVVSTSDSAEIKSSIIPALARMSLSPLNTLSTLAMKSLFQQVNGNEKFTLHLRSLSVPIDGEKDLKTTSYARQLCDTMNRLNARLGMNGPIKHRKWETLHALAEGPTLNKLEHLISGTNLLGAVLVTYVDGAYQDHSIHQDLSMLTTSDGPPKYRPDLEIIRNVQIQRVIHPAKQYLNFVFLQEEFLITRHPDIGYELPSLIRNVLKALMSIERDAAKTQKEVILLDIGEDDRKMMAEEKKRWKQREERLRQAGHEDAVDAWMKREIQPSTEIGKYIRSVTMIRGEAVLLVQLQKFLWVIFFPIDTKYKSRPDLASTIRNESALMAAYSAESIGQRDHSPIAAAGMVCKRSIGHCEAHTTSESQSPAIGK
ncbi:hypothetical protein BLNAU_7135 [Blattamonas nauphoetae]|uniref:Uncharacterized protein n=1 Tax=Blattamonas nauphoetae TaxID=2049346 RepID=A0ABQ9Y2J2_9EUKA|nr:hypothetical protein BLNAU_7135 [Blattamonas nauphoetae]